MIKQITKSYNVVEDKNNVDPHNHTSCNGSFNTKNKSAKISLRAPSIKWKEWECISASGENVFPRRNGDDSKPPESFVAKSQYFSWKIDSIAEQPFVLTPYGCLQTKHSASDWHKLQAAARNQAGPFYSFLVCYFFQSLKGTSHSLGENTDKSRWQHQLQPE